MYYHFQTLIKFHCQLSLIVSLRLRKHFILNCSKSFIQFLSECLVNLLRIELRDLRKEYVVKNRKKVSELTQKRTPLHKRRIILSSTKGLQLISIITSFVLKRLTQYGTVCFILYSVYQSQSTLPRKPKMEQKQEKEEVVP